ncbi:MAG: methylmalonyl-CoA epimerase [Anaerolineales bacterium]
MAKITGINHIALVVPEMEQALKFWRDILGLPLQGVNDMPEQSSRIAFLPAGVGEVELVQPTTPDSGVAKFLQKRGPGIHHVCFETDDLDGMIDLLKGKGVRLIGEKPSTGAGGKRMIFIHPESAGGVLVELYEGKT